MRNANAHSGFLSRYDTQPSILDFALPAVRPGSSSHEPSSKRPKLSDTGSSIRSKLEGKQYSSLESLENDVETVTSEMLKPLMAKEAATTGSAFGAPSQLSPAESRHWTEVLTFQKILKNMVQHESSVKTARADKSGQKTETTTNGIKKEEEDDDTDILGNGRRVLTVYAAAPQPKQLFSSFQRPIRNNDSTKTLDAAVGITMPLRDGGLPNILSVTTIPQLPINDSTETKKSRPTFGDRFAPLRTLRPLEPPQPSKQTTTKGNTLEFVSSDDLVRRTRRGSYNWCGSELSVGQWLGYGGVESFQEPSSPEAKRKQRDRALSTGEPRPQPSKADLLAIQRAREDALFRKVYSSFAPTHDDAGAVVPEEVKNEMWWNKIGQQRAQRALLIDPDLPAFGEPVQSQTANGQDEDEVEAFKKAVEEFDPESLKPDRDERSDEEKGTDALLEEISDLMETLYSFQLIRNMSVSKPQTREAQEITKKSIGTPSTPSEAEVDVYKTLRAQLMLLISTLPPYLVAKLDGDRLKELNVSGRILVETSDDHGIMEEDQITRLAKQTALSSAVGPQAVPRPEARSFSSYPAASSHFNRTPGAQAPIPRPTPSNYFPQQQQASRPAPLPYQRTAAGVQTPAGNYTPRPGTQTPTQQYPPATPRPGGYGQGGSSYLQQLQQIAGQPVRPGSSQYYGSTPQAAAPNRAYPAQPPVPNYQRPSSTAPMYYPQSPHQRTASPLNAGGSVGPPSYGNVNRQPYAAPGGQARSQYIPPGGSQPQYHPSAGFTPNIPNANADQQSAVRAQLAAQAQARLAAATAPHHGVSPNRQSSGTPQQAYSQSPNVNGTPMVAQRS
jgi:hypothetical protein